MIARVAPRGRLPRALVAVYAESSSPPCWRWPPRCCCAHASRRGRDRADARRHDDGRRRGGALGAGRRPADAREALDEIWRRATSSAWRAPTGASSPAARSGSIRVKYTERERYVCLLFRPFVLLALPGARVRDGRRRAAIVRWRIERGVLVSRDGRGGNGYLEIDIQRCPPTSRARAAARRGRGRELLPGDRAGLALGLHEHPVAHPRARHPRLPALAGAARPRPVARRALRSIGGPASRTSRTPPARCRPSAPSAARTRGRGRSATPRRRAQP